MFSFPSAGSCCKIVDALLNVFRGRRRDGRTAAMKPNFALTLSFDGIGLLQRSFPGWLRVGETVSLERPDLADALRELRDMAAALGAEPAGDIACKLVLPNEQIRYQTIQTGEVPGFQRANLARDALDGQTPYPVDELAFDWSAEGELTHIAAVALETLEEAESFAQMHGFAPFSFVATAPASAFLGEPFFGTPARVAALLDDGDTVVRDTNPIRIIGTATPPPLARAAEAMPHADTAPAPQPETAPTAQPSAKAAQSFDPARAPADDVPVTEATTPPDPGAPVQVTETPDINPSAADARQSAAPTGTDTGKAAKPTLTSEDIHKEDRRTAPAVSFSTVRHTDDGQTPRDSISAAPRLSGVSRDVSGTTAASIPIPASQTDTPRPQRGPLHLSLPEAAATSQDGSATAEEGRIPVPPLGGQSSGAATHTPDQSPPDGNAAKHDEADTTPAAEKTRQDDAFVSRRAAVPHPLPATAPSAARARASAPAQTNPEKPHRRLSIGLGSTALVPADPEIAARGKPKHLGLILTAALLLFLAAVAAWTSLFMDDNVSGLLGRDADIDLAVAPEALPQTPPPDPIEAKVAPEPQPDNAPREGQSPPPALDLGIPVQIPVQEEAQSEMSDAQIDDAYAATGIWQRAPVAGQSPVADSIDTLYHTSIDPKVPVFDALALPSPKAALSDVLPGNRASPAAAGTRFALDARGFVRATPQGALTPEGVLVHAGKPASQPPQLPQRLTQAPAPTEAETASIIRLATIRPHLRPADLIEQSERSQLGGRSRLELAAFRPKIRPDLPAQKIEEEQNQTPTEQAVLISKRPEERPRSIAKIVARAEKQTAAVQTAAMVAPRTVAPSIPSSASVAKQATVRGALNLRKVNLIGVSGKPASRSALVRMSNGRIKKVKVGDRIDGGKVVAIGERELRYSKKGRNVVLQMPKG